MKALMKKTLAALLAVAMVLTAVGVTTTTADAKKAKVKKITLSAKKKTLKVGKSFTLKVKSVKPKKASKAVKWKSSNKKVATVNAKGKVVAKKAGKATITATSKSNKKVKSTCKITVKTAGTGGTTVEPSTEPSTAPSQNPPAASTAPSQNPPAASTDPSQNPPAASTDPGTSPSTEPSTDPSTAPSTEPSADPSTAPSADPSTEPSTSPSTSPSTEPTYTSVAPTKDDAGNDVYTLSDDDSYKMTVTKGGKEEEVAFTQEDIADALEDAVNYEAISRELDKCFDDSTEATPKTTTVLGKTISIDFGEEQWANTYTDDNNQYSMSQSGRNATVTIEGKTYNLTGNVQKNYWEGVCNGYQVYMEAPADKVDEYGFSKIKVGISNDNAAVKYEVTTDEGTDDQASYVITATESNLTITEGDATVFSYANNKLTIAEKYASKFGLAKKA